MLKQDYKEGEMTLSSALALAVKVLNKTMDVSKLSAEKGEAGEDVLVLLRCQPSLFLPNANNAVTRRQWKLPP